ncbi:MAG: hypothetical protein JSS76_04800 [Bacteroidetes bacterium]|nr:hypothetical protein [Bacteroidota bacterium]
MRQLFFLTIMLLIFSSCKKADPANPSRFAITGDYHFTVITYNTEAVPNYYDTVIYDGSITLMNPDDGHRVRISYPYNKSTILMTIDSNLSGGSAACPHGGGSPINGRYAHNILRLQDYTWMCNTGQGISTEIDGIKY